MLGFWTGLLDAGGYYGNEPQAFKADYEQLFRSTLQRAFPGGRAEARNAGAHFTREWVHNIATVMQDLRNRAAHHEPLVGGFPLNGQKDRHGNPVRLSVQQGHEAYLRLARMIDRDLGAWLMNNSTVPALLAAKPPTASPPPRGQTLRREDRAGCGGCSPQALVPNPPNPMPSDAGRDRRSSDRCSKGALGDAATFIVVENESAFTHELGRPGLLHDRCRQPGRLFA